MNHKQKFFYIALGAVIMLFGLGVGAIVSPPLIAQKTGMFGEIQCTGLTVVDTAGEPVVVLRTDETLGNGLVIHSPSGLPAVLLYADETGNGITVADKSGEPAVVLRTSQLANRVIVRNPAGKEGVRLSAGELTNRVIVRNKAEANAVLLYSGELANRITVHDKTGIIRWEAP